MAANTPSNTMDSEPDSRPNTTPNSETTTVTPIDSRRILCSAPACSMLQRSAFSAQALPRHTGEVPEGRRGKASAEASLDFRSDHFNDRRCGFPPPCPPPYDGGGERL